MSLELLVPVAAAGLLGSVHCAGMCGGFVAIAGYGVSGRTRLGAQFGYNAGRLVSYLTLGTISGALGRALDLAGSAAGLGRIAAIVSGSVMILWGLGALLETQGVRVFGRQLHMPQALAHFLTQLGKRPPLARGAILGLATALLPCGWLYAFAVAAASTASPVRGALVLGALWLGNLPALLGLGLVVGAALGRLRQHLPVLSAALIFSVGLFTLSTRANLPAFALASIGAHDTSTLPRAADCPCHRKRH